MTRLPRSPQKRPSERFLQDYSNATKAQLLHEVRRLAAEKAALERRNRRLITANAKASMHKATGGIGQPALLMQMKPIHAAAVRHMEQPRRQGQPLPSNAGYAVLAFDLNKFKQVNDFHGHGEGDNVLRDVYNVLRKNSRKTDLIAHPSGDEFFMVLTEVSRETAIGLARKIRLEVQKAVIRHGVTTSIGLAYFDPLTMAEKTPESMIKLADQGLIRTKGRDEAENAKYQNRVVLVTVNSEKIVVDAGNRPAFEGTPKEPSLTTTRPRKARSPKA